MRGRGSRKNKPVILVDFDGISDVQPSDTAVDALAKSGRQADKDRARAAHLRRHFGITPEDYDEMLFNQDGKCGVCKRLASDFKTRLSVDHDHHTLDIRGLLCSNCNRNIIGRHRDPGIFRNAAVYLEGPFTGWKAPGNRPKRRKKKKP